MRSFHLTKKLEEIINVLGFTDENTTVISLLWYKMVPWSRSFYVYDTCMAFRLKTFISYLESKFGPKIIPA